MDLYAHMLTRDEKINSYIEKNYGPVPRLRGVRFMKVENPGQGDPYDSEIILFNKFVGQDVIYIRTRCGDCGMGYDDESSNYIYCGGKEWEEKYHDLLVSHITEDYDSTYCTHYFRAVINDEYNEIIKMLSE